MTYPRPAAVVVLAAGEGTRMRSATPKVLHTLAGRSMLGHALAAARSLEPDRVVVVVRHGRDAVVAHALEVDADVLIADQDDIPGTGRAVQCGLTVLDADAHAGPTRDAAPAEALPGEVDGAVVVLAGDIPLLDGATLSVLLDAHAAGAHAVTVLTTEVADPTGYGRILRDADGGPDVAAIVEEKDADDAQRAVREINSSVYVFDAAVLRRCLGRLGRDNARAREVVTPQG